MRCRPSRWLWGLLPLALLAYLINVGERPRIEKDLQSRTVLALEAAGHSWASPSFKGRDGLIIGTAEEESQQTQALTVARNVWGTRIADNGTSLIELIKPYAWSAKREPGVVRLTGYVPSDAERKAIVAAAKVAFPVAQIDDKMKLGRGVPMRPQWLGGATYSLAQLALLERGEVNLEDLGLSISGAVGNPRDYAVVNDALTRLPPKITLLRQNITAPVVSPYVLSAKLNPNKTVTLTGYVPSGAVRTSLLDAARKTFRGYQVTDQLQIAGGAPPAFGDTVIGLMPQLSRLESGELSFKGPAVSLSGITAEQDDAEAFTKSFQTAVIAPYTPSVRVDYRGARKNIISPYVWSACYKDEVLTLDGYVPDEATRKSLTAYAGQRFLGRTVADRLQVADGAPEPRAGWITSTQAGLRALSIVGTGCAKQVDRTLTVQGETPVAGLPERVANILGQALPQGYVSNAQIALIVPPAPVVVKPAPEPVVVKPAPEPVVVQPAPEPVVVKPPEPPTVSPFYTTVKYDGLNLMFDGVVPSDQARQLIMANAKRVFPERSFTDRMVVAKGSRARWGDVMNAGLGQLAQLDAGQFTLSDNSAFLSGATDNEKILTTARKTVATGMVSGYRGDHQLTYIAPPKPDPKIVATKQELAKYDVGALLKSDKALSGSECQAVLETVARRGQALFGRGSAIIDATGKQTLDLLVPVTKRCPTARLRIAGHTDSDGATAFNQRLSERRAFAVVSYLGEAGADKSRMTSIGYGESTPIAENTTPPNKAQNRRIEFEVELQ